MRLVLRLVISTAILTAFALPASAQYMYLDSNANGIHDAADRLNANGTATTVDIWLNTNTNRNGTTALCDDNAATALSINSYAFNLLASGGTVSYTTYVNQQATAMPNPAQVVNPGDGVSYKNGFFGTSYIAAGLYRLGTLTITGDRKFEKEENGKKYHRVERTYGSFGRSFSLPDDASPGKVTTDFKDGVLRVHLAKNAKARPQQVEVSVS